MAEQDYKLRLVGLVNLFSFHHVSVCVIDPSIHQVILIIIKNRIKSG